MPKKPFKPKKKNRHHPGARPPRPEHRRSGGGRGPRERDTPTVIEIVITGIDADGELKSEVVDYDGRQPQLKLTGRRLATLKVGDHALVQLTPTGAQSFTALVIRKIENRIVHILGVFRATPEGGRVQPADKKAKSDLFVASRNTKGAVDGELVQIEILETKRLGLPEAKVIEKVGRIDEPRAFSIIAIHENEIPTAFPPEAVKIAEDAKPVELGKRTDLRKFPLITIDGEDARDFDDAVFAEPDGNGGWHLLVAIADVAHYVRPNSALDHAAYERGNSVYFPDRVVPMLPEALSNELCSLKPNVERATMAVHMYITADGELKKYEFVRGLMRSHARLTYTQVQAAIEGRTDAVTEKLLDPIINNLLGAFKALRKARAKRGTLELAIPEYKAKISPEGKVLAIEKRMQQTAHQLIEEFMVTANVAAALALEGTNSCVYRIHDVPSEEKRDGLTDFLDSLDFRLPHGQQLTSRGLADILKKFEGRPEQTLVSEMMLRSQSQAEYSPTNIGHFGLALSHYAHFTSPIRRYADLLVHRALIKKYKLGDDALPADQQAKLADMAEHISMTERRASNAERSATDRYVASFLGDRVGAVFAASISGVTNFGLFVRLDETGADGLIPMRALGNDFFMFNEGAKTLTGRRSGVRYRLGDKLTVTLREAEALTGRLLLEPVLPDAPSETRGNRGPRSNSRRDSRGSDRRDDHKKRRRR